MRDGEVLASLWGGTVEDLVVDVCFGELSFSVRAPHRTGDDVMTVYRHRIQFHGISRLELVNEIETPWNYAELTEIRVSRVSGTDLAQFEMYLWSEDAIMKGRFKQLVVDGAAVSIDPVMRPY